MELKGEQRINTDRERVFSALNDIAVLRQCIPGCEDLKRLDHESLAAIVSLKVGPIKANFNGTIRISNLNSPISYTISGEGTGGVAGHAKGSADVVLEEENRITILKYTVKAAVGGKIAQIGSRIINATANKLAGKFFAKFATVLEADSGSAPMGIVGQGAS